MSLCKDIHDVGGSQTLDHNVSPALRHHNVVGKGPFLPPKPLPNRWVLSYYRRGPEVSRTTARPVLHRLPCTDDSRVETPDQLKYTVTSPLPKGMVSGFQLGNGLLGL